VDSSLTFFSSSPSSALKLNVLIALTLTAWKEEISLNHDESDYEVYEVCEHENYDSRRRSSLIIQSICMVREKQIFLSIVETTKR
jgi:hypothetical protein